MDDGKKRCPAKIDDTEYECQCELEAGHTGPHTVNFSTYGYIPGKKEKVPATLTWNWDLANKGVNNE